MFRSSTALCVLPTAGGKTEIFIAIIQKAISLKPDFKCVVILNKVSLLRQTKRRIEKALPGIAVSVFSGTEQEKDLSGQVIVATIQSIYDTKIDGINSAIIDECHNIGSEDGRYQKFLELNKHEKFKTIGFTATPYRANDGHIYGEDKFFKKIAFRLPMKELIDEGFLVKPILKKPDEQFDTKDLKIKMGDYDQVELSRLVSDDYKISRQINDAISRLKDRKYVVWSCVNIEHCEKVFNALKDRGESVFRIHSKMSDEERTSSTNGFETSGRHLVFVTIVSEGYDFPAIDAIVLMRPTRSPVMYVQVVGRGLRLSKDKTDCLVLDYGQIVESLGPVDDPKVRKKGERNRSTGDGPKLVKLCETCGSYSPPAAKFCEDCGAQFPGVTKNLDTKASVSGDILGGKTKPRTVQVASVRFDKYVSKNGNMCLRVEYRPTGFLGLPIYEYFSWNHEIGYKNMQKRMVELDAEIAKNIEDQVEQTPGRIPHSIEVISENGYDKIKKLNFI